MRKLTQNMINALTGARYAEYNKGRRYSDADAITTGWNMYGVDGRTLSAMRKRGLCMGDGGLTPEGVSERNKITGETEEDAPNVTVSKINECARCGERMTSEEARTHTHFRPVWQLLEQGTAVQSAIIGVTAPNGVEWPDSVRSLSPWWHRSRDESGTESVKALCNMIDAFHGEWNLYEMPNGDVVVAWLWENTQDVCSVFYVTVETEPYIVSAEIMVSIPGIPDLTVSEGRGEFIITPGYSTLADIERMWSVRKWGEYADNGLIRAHGVRYVGPLNAR